MAATQQKRSKELRSISYELFIAALSVLSIFNLGHHADGVRQHRRRQSRKSVAQRQHYDFLAPRKKEEEHSDAEVLASTDPRAKLAELQALLAAQQEAQLAVQAKMTELEALLPSPVTVT
jgi:hypothetical protein